MPDDKTDDRPGVDYRTEIEQIEAAAVELAVESGRIVLEFYGQARGTSGGLAVDYKDKGRSDPVTAADREIEARLAKAVSERFPGHSIIGEEGAPGNPSAEYLWIVDPVDGTSNFVNQLPCFAVSIGVLRRGRPVVGAIFVPGEVALGGGVYHARRGGGAFLRSTTDGTEKPVHVVADSELSPSRLVSLPGAWHYAFRFHPRLGRALGQSRTLGSAAAELAYVAAGIFQVGLYRSLKIWDVAAGVLIIQEAGGVVYRWRGWRGGWQPLVEFAARRRRPDDPTGLRRWSEPLLVGGLGPAGDVARLVRPTFTPPRFLHRLLGWLKHRQRREQKRRG